ncbi:MAG: o-succinylbenzoate--CoA ligase [Candidatus Omnitrophica bacterium]|nr:o-succinylbenzoate--CoA ligase [Candidatus Omnitrophota bacterium]
MKLNDNIDCPLLNAAKNHPQKTAVFWGSRRISFLQLHQYVNATVRSLKERDIRSGQRVALVADNSVEALIVCWGLWRLGVVVCPINPRFPIERIKNILELLDVRAVVYARTSSTGPLKGPWSIFEITDLIVFEHKEVADALDQKQHQFGSGQAAVIVLTSGTTTQPKAAVLTFGNLYFNASGSNDVIPVFHDSVWLLSLPLFHVSGLGIIWRCVLAGAAIRISAQEDLLRLVGEGKATHVSLVLTQLVRLCEKAAVPNQLKVVLLGGSSFPSHVLSQALEAGLPIYLSYGLTEMASQVATGRLKDINTGCARLLPYREMKIDAHGEICLRGPTLFSGYLNRKDITRPVDSEGWFHSGDLGLLDAHGCLKVLGRRDDMFISGGENIHPQEIESILGQIPGILQVVVVPREDAQFGQRPVAFIQWDNLQPSWSESKMIEHLLAKLPKFKIPCAFYPWPADVQQGIKINRQFLKQRANASK